MSVTPSAGQSGGRFLVPFLVGDALLLIAAWALFAQGNRPLSGVEVGAVAACVALGAWLGVWPWVLRHRIEMRRLETTDLADTVARIHQLEDVARQVSLATNKWQSAQDSADRVVRTAGEMTERIVTEQTSFREYLEKAQDTERAHLRLEVEKLRRNEGAWLQVLVFMLDHIFALFTAASRSGQPNVVNQIGRFQSACLDAAHRVGLTALVVEPGTAFDPEAHALPDGVDASAVAEAVTATLAPGYNYQSRLLRKPLVSLGAAPHSAAPSADSFPPTPATSFTTSPSVAETEDSPPSSGDTVAGGTWNGDADGSEAPPSPS